jgi:surfactin synthase thioesterase subunit
MNLLICFPYAGAGVSMFRSWRVALSSRCDLLPVQLPGREERFQETPYEDVSEAITGTMPTIGSKVQVAQNIFIFGHSLGAALAYELAAQLSKQSIKVSRLIASGAHAPTRQRSRHASGMTDEEFIAQVRSLAGYAHPALEDPEMREFLLPILRADVEMHESYLTDHREPLGIPITCIRGSSDDLVSSEDIGLWQEVTTGSLDVIEVEGGHMYLIDRPRLILDTLGSLLPYSA